jgi:hypothetical protein
MPPSTVVARTAPGRRAAVRQDTERRTAVRRAAPVGAITRGTTNPNRLRRADRWMVGTLAGLLRSTADPLVVDLGYGASPVTTLELRDRLRAVRPDVRVVGIEIDPARVEAARDLADESLQFVLGGFELPVPGGGRPVLVRAFNVLRQYDEGEVAAAWATVLDRVAPGGLLVDGTCDEVGRRAAWVVVQPSTGPTSLTLSLRLAGLRAPSDVAERLPKVLIHHNVRGTRLHAWLSALDQAWERSAPLSVYGPRQRFVAAVRAVRDDGWPVIGGPTRWRLGEVTVAWDAVRPDLPPT